ncbi:ATP-dependent DNA helicase DinG, partial [Neisseria sp. P0006.S006]
HLPKKALSRFAAEHSWNIAVWTLEKLPQLTGKIAALTDKAELANLADEAATSLLDSLHEWQFHLAEEPSLSLGSSENDRRKHNEPTWLWEDGKIPEGLETTVSNTAIAARSLLKHVVGLNDALSAARRDKEQDGALLDRLTSEFGLFIARIEQISAVWDLLSTVPIEGEEPLAKWITRRADDKND